MALAIFSHICKLPLFGGRVAIDTVSEVTTYTFSSLSDIHS
jgi:hypothetical protein